MRHGLRFWLTLFFVAVSLFAGLGFLVKLVEFWASLEDHAMLGFAIAPLTNHFLVAGGFLALLIWAFLSGQFSNAEQVKQDRLDEQEVFDREDEHVRKLREAEGEA